ncbi:MAG TPA: hypothetical protein VKY85_17850 [Candidatus Angelobacter sp.]|nr:hypothetical protein [Candidatus Angelobacter sp.]
MKQPVNPGEWLICRYSPVTLFSLRSTYATSKGGKTLLTPTPYAVKMALIDACFRVFPAEQAEKAARDVFNLVKERPVRIKPPEECIVQNTFLRVLQPARDVTGEEGGNGPFSRTIAYREFVFFRGEMEIAITADSSALEAMQTLLTHINYFGKRGSHWQFLGAQTHQGRLPYGFSIVATEIAQYPLDVVGRYRVTEYLDEFGPKLCAARDGFERISTYHDGDVKLGEHRILQSTLLPYERKAAGRHFTHYRRAV